MSRHIPVMLNEVISVLAPKDGGIYVDGTFGAGGYAAAILDGAACTVWGIDRDPRAISEGMKLHRRHGGRLKLVHGCLGEMAHLVDEAHLGAIDGIALDVGISSDQLDDPARGFSFHGDGPLDMRMDQVGPTAADLLNACSEAELADIIHDYGEERGARRIARAIVEAREVEPILTVSQLAAIVRRIVKRSRDGIDPATRTFMALRIRVNDELGELHRGLRAAEKILAPGGRLAVVSFHSLEDRTVKEFLRRRSGRAPGVSRHQPEDPAQDHAPSFRLIRPGLIRPGDGETAANPRARSARLRAAERTEAPPWPALKAA